MTLIRWNNNSEPNLINKMVDDFFRFDGMLDNRFTNKATVNAVNVLQTDNGFEIEVAMPGLDRSDFDIKVEEDVLVISAEKQNEIVEDSNNQEATTNENNDKVPTRRYVRKEFNYTSFSRSFQLPEGTDEENIEAKYNNGILTISVPLVPEEEKQPTVRNINVG